MVDIGKILVLVDFSRNSAEAVRYGLTLAHSLGARLCFLHTVNQRIMDALQELSGKGYNGDFLQALKKLMEDRENDLRAFVPKEELAGVEAEFLIRKGEPVEEVVGAAGEYSVDLIVVGSQGHAASANDSVGTVAQDVINRARCPVLVVRPIEHDFIEGP